MAPFFHGGYHQAMSVCMLYLVWLCLWLVWTFICKWHSWSVSQMSRRAGAFATLKHLKLCEGELCQAFLTQRQVAQRRCMVTSQVRTLGARLSILTPRIGRDPWTPNLSSPTRYHCAASYATNSKPSPFRLLGPFNFENKKKTWSTLQS